MTDFINKLVDGNVDRMEIRSQVDLRGEPFKSFKFLPADTLNVRHQATVIDQKSLAGDILIYGNEQFGIWGDYRWGDGKDKDLIWDSEITFWDTNNWEADTYAFILGSNVFGILGSSKLGSTLTPFQTIRIIPPNNTFREPFLSNYFIDTEETTATLGVYSWE